LAVYERRLVDSDRDGCDGSVMQVRAWLVAGIAAVIFTLSLQAQPEQPPWLGTWRLNDARSTKRAVESPYKRVTTRIEPAGDGLKVTYEMVGTRGGVTHLEWTGRFDAIDYAVQGVDYVLTNAYRQIDSRRYEIVVKVDGAVAATARAEVSSDGGTLTVITAERDARGRSVTTTAVYDRK
jgi:hypothetical protein